MGALSLPRNALKVIPPRSLDSRMIHLLSITRWNRGYRRVLVGIRLERLWLVISRRDNGIGSGCFRAPYQFPGVPKGIKNGGADGTRTPQRKKRCASFPLCHSGASAFAKTTADKPVDRRVCRHSSLSCYAGNFIGVKHASRVREGRSLCAQARSGNNGGIHSDDKAASWVLCFWTEYQRIYGLKKN